jgi:hypothetical protein
MQSVSEDALHVLQLIAFLVQGVESTTLHQLLPAVGNVNRIVEKLGPLSVTSHQGKFITMLASIRLYILDMRLPEHPFLANIRTFYYGNLNECGISNPGDINLFDGSWISSRDDNIERLFAHQLSSDPDESTVEACAIFLSCIYHHKPRTTTLGAVVRALHHDVSANWKAHSLQTIGHIYGKTGNYREAREFYETLKLSNS